MSTASRARQFPVGRRQHVPVADAGCGCRPRRPRLLSLPSFLRSGGAKAAAVRRSGGGGEQQYPSSATSTASFSSSCAGATRSSTGYSSAYSSDHYSSLATRQQQETPATKKKKEPLASKRKRNKTVATAEDGGVGVAVEKDSYDPRADFRESMVQMVVEMGLCDWDGLRCMLRRLLALNAPRHHAAILAAFAEVCAQIVAAPPSPPCHQYRR